MSVVVGTKLSVVLVVVGVFEEKIRKEKKEFRLFEILWFIRARNLWIRRGVNSKV